MTPAARRAFALATVFLPLVACAGVQQHPAPAPLAAPAVAAVAYSNTVRWSTASEDDNFGFDVFRGESEGGPFVRLNPTPLEGGGTTDEPRSYLFVDDAIDPHRTYYYYVESISMSGERKRFTPIGRAASKLPGGPG